MKKILIALILTVFLTAIAFIKPVESHAETPDVFMMNEIYLYDHDSFNFAPTFENDYLLNATILPNAVETQISAFIGWYKDLGYNQLLVPYYGDDVDNDHLVYFAIPCYDILGANFQLGYIAQTPMNLRFGVTFTDGTTQQWDTETNGFGKQILTISNTNLLKNIESFWWEAKTADYVPSFKFLGVTDGYDIGYQNGEQTGYDNGYQVGYNLGFRNGFQDGVTQSEDVVIYEKILNFNQQIKNGNFENTTNWEVANGNFTADNNTGVLSATSQYGRITQRNISFVNNHQYLLLGKIRTTQIDNTFYVLINKDTNYSVRTGTATTSWKRLDRIFTYTQTSGNGSLVIGNDSTQDFDSLELKNIMLIDLTQMYGEGYEPTLEEAKLIFSAEYYQYTENFEISLGYFTGYFDGRDSGLSEGINIGESNQITMSWVQSIFRAIQGVLNIQIFPKVTIGVIVGIPFIISLAWFIIKMFRGGGGGD